MSDSWIDEEIIMHELEGNILNYLTKDAYYEAIDKIVKRIPISNWQPNFVLNALTLNDLLFLDKILDCQNVCQEVAEITLPQIIITIGMRAIDQGVLNFDKPGKNPKIEYYRFITKL